MGNGNDSRRIEDAAEFRGHVKASLATIEKAMDKREKASSEQWGEMTKQGLIIAGIKSRLNEVESRLKALKSQDRKVTLKGAAALIGGGAGGGGIVSWLIQLFSG